MRKWILAAGAAALATTAPALADPKGGQGAGKGGQHAQQGAGHGKANKDRGGGKGQIAQSERSGGKGQGNARRDARPAAKEGRGENRARGQGRDDVRVVRADDRGRDRDRDRDIVRVRDFDNDDYVARWGRHGFARGYVDGCPPGLAKKGNGCLPPGQAKKLVGTLLPAAYSGRALSGPYRDWYRDDDRYLYRMGPDGIYRVNRASNLIDALIPSYLNDYGYYPVGMAYPSPYNFYNVPVQYSSYWPDNGDYAYRYGNGAIYQVDPGTSAIRSIVALLAGDLSVGQPLPLGYSSYNVPLSYRAQYYDTPDNWYRYNDGYVYRVDPTTQLITAVIRAIV